MALSEDRRKIEQLRARFDDSIMAIDGVESIGVGLNEKGETCLVIGVSVPAEQVRSRLPEEIFQAPVEIIDIGEVSAQ